MGGTRGSGSAALVEFGEDGGDDLVHVADDGIGRLGHHGRLGVGVDGDDRLGRGAAGPVLDGAGDAARDIEIGLIRLPVWPTCS